MPMRRLGRLKPEEKRSRQAVDLFGCLPCPPSLPQLSRSQFFYSISPPRLRLASLAMGKSRSGVLLALLLVCAAVAAAAAAAVPGSKGRAGRVGRRWRARIWRRGGSAWRAAAGAGAGGAAARRSMTCALGPPRRGGCPTRCSLATRPPAAPPTPGDDDAA